MNFTTKKLIIRRPDDWHVHLRDGYLLTKVLSYTSTIYGRAIIMPNLSPPITNIAYGESYRNRILSIIKNNHSFKPLMTCYLTESLNPNEVEKGFKSGLFAAIKLYPINSTINSSYGIKKITFITKILERMQKINMPLLIHCETADFKIDIFDRESYFIDNVIKQLHKQFPELKMVMEHITTKTAVDYVKSTNEKIGATITPHHLMFNRNNLLTNNGIYPHLYCLPILKSKIHQQALREAISSGNKKFFLGTDSAPHFRHLKESGCGCAGIFTSPTALLAYATVFEELNALEYFESFCSENGPNFYGLSLNKDTITLVKKPWKIQNNISIGQHSLIPFLAGTIINWSIENNA
ncbi:MAG: dihydroorotase [Pantoea sp. Brub]|nr:dihydroorotase [Pantoea sp. Brub]